MSAGVFAIHAKPGRQTALVLSWFLFAAAWVCIFMLRRRGIARIPRIA